MHAAVVGIAVVAIIMLVIGRQLVGETINIRRLVVLPVVLTVVGVVDLTGNGRALLPIDVVFLALTAVLLAAIGVAQGRALQLETRGGELWARMPPMALWLWAGVIAVRVGSTVLAATCGAPVAASTAPLLFLLGVNRLGQAAPVFAFVVRAGVPRGIPGAGRNREVRRQAVAGAVSWGAVQQVRDARVARRRQRRRR